MTIKFHTGAYNLKNEFCKHGSECQKRYRCMELSYVMVFFDGEIHTDCGWIYL